MRISDWSSDVCSSDLILALQIDFCAAEIGRQPLGEPQRAGTADIMFEQIVEFGLEGGVGLRGAIFAFEGEDQRHQRFGDIAAAERSEEHTSELQSLMRISYAVFCLKTKTTTINHKKPNRK